MDDMDVDTDYNNVQNQYDCNLSEQRPSSVVYTHTFNILKAVNAQIAALLKEPLKNTK